MAVKKKDIIKTLQKSAAEIEAEKHVISEITFPQTTKHGLVFMQSFHKLGKKVSIYSHIYYIGETPPIKGKRHYKSLVRTYEITKGRDLKDYVKDYRTKYTSTVVTKEFEKDYIKHVITPIIKTPIKREVLQNTNDLHKFTMYTVEGEKVENLTIRWDEGVYSYKGEISGKAVWWSKEGYYIPDEENEGYPDPDFILHDLELNEKYFSSLLDYSDIL